MKFTRRKGGTINSYPKKVAVALTRDSLRLEWFLRLIVITVAGILLFWGWKLDVASKGFKVGSPSPRDYYVLSDVAYVDEAVTEQLRESQASRVLGVVVHDVSLLPIVKTVLEEIDKSSTWLYFPQGLADILNTMPAQKREVVLGVTRDLGLRLMVFNGDIFDGNDLKLDLWRYLSDTDLSIADQNIVYQILSYLLDLAVKVDAEATSLVREFYRSGIDPIERLLQPGTLLVKKGDVITPEIAEILKSQGYLEERFPWMQLLLSLFIVFLWTFLHRYTELREWRETSARKMTYFVTLLLLAWILQFGMARVNHFCIGLGILPIVGLSYMTMPFISAMYLGLSGGLLGVMVSSSNSFTYLYAMLPVVLITVLAHALFKDKPTTRGKALLRILTVGLGAMALWFVFIGVFYNVPTAKETLIILIAIFILSGAFVLLLPLFEGIFDVVSPIRLMELTHPSNPLLKRLQIEAPGTYHHVMTVSTLAEAAAERIGANALLVRGGAYYHDIGKLKRPHYFIENQIEGENVHDTLSPSISALVILSHVQDGVNLAKEYGLPSAMIDFITEHHGTTCLSYFYNRAKEREEHVERDQYCYPGPKPRSKETALLMLADSTEAAVRALGSSVLNVPALNDAIRQVIEVKKKEGQLDEVDLTMRDLNDIQQAFVKTLMSMYHTRQIKERK
ncbi:HD family phosphohydrolase [Acetomicrobium hydrogeniformans]|uniref:HDIG domain protein n=1 Tax=Acetomicrobium hydrogeniformans ATCC BAA-1850 TaxID=592015 RepID=A0A0T5XCC3_9BACT|nr:HDIG domain-containing metalloprotein [Acetomicrobium hydrogeniformans]KRT36013.1 HDIG domain protein [Acetomicrobium hydrogeniformans ATCC BAA-1850]